MGLSMLFNRNFHSFYKKQDEEFTGTMRNLQELCKRFVSSSEIVKIIALQILCVLKDLGSVYILAYATDEVVVYLSGEVGNITVAFILMGSVMLMGVVIATMDIRVSEGLQVKIRRRLLSAYEEKIMTVRLDQAESLDRGQLMNTFSSDLNKLCQWFRWTLPKIINLTFYLIGAIIYSFVQNVWLTFSVVPAVMLIVPMLLKIVKKLGGSVEKERSAADRVMKMAGEVFAGAELIKAFSAEEKIQVKIGKELAEKEKQERHAAVYKSLSRALGFIISYLPGIIAGLAGGWFLLRGQITVGFLIAFIQMLMGRVSYAFPQFSDYISTSREADVYSRRILEFLSMPDEKTGGSEGVVSADLPLISFEHVGFGYPNRERILKDVSFTVRKGEKAAFVGMSGCGKSTILKLVMGYYPDSYTGSIRIGGTELRDWDQSKLREMMAPVFQDSFLFSGTVKDNLSMTDRIGRLEEVANSFGFSEEFLETEVGEGGIRVSGGQRQRIAIARGQLKNADIYLLDEPLANLDYITEKQILREMETTLAGKTQLLVEHRLEAAEDSDRIYYIADGKIAEEGTHQELMEENGLYAALYHKQTLEAGGAAT